MPLPPDATQDAMSHRNFRNSPHVQRAEAYFNERSSPHEIFVIPLNARRADSAANELSGAERDFNRRRRNQHALEDAPYSTVNFTSMLLRVAFE
jgi:hypothetical protein